MRKQPAKDGVGQLVLQIVIPEGKAKDRTGETEGNGPGASGVPSAVRSEPERKRKWYSLMDKVYALANLQAAWGRVWANQGAAGVDGVSVKQYAANAEGNLRQLAEDLRRKSYRPQPVRRVYIPKSGGGQRPLGIPTVRDRIVQQAVRQILEPIFEGEFRQSSHGFRPERGCATALDVVERAVRHGYSWVVDADIEAFFDSVDHEKLVTALNEEVADGSVLKLVRQILRAGVIEPGTAEKEPTELGTPQGGPLSPLLANIYLHAFDQRMEEAGYGLVRYADDFVIFARSESDAAAALELAGRVLEGEWGLKLHPEKTRVISVDAGFEFLGFHYFRDPKTGMRCKEVRHKSVHRFREAVRQLTPRLRAQRPVKARHVTLGRLAKNQQVKRTVERVNHYLRGWHWYFKGVRTRWRAPFDRMDSFVRRRVRQAIVGRVGSGWWHQRLSNEILRQLGLVTLEDLHTRYLKGQLEAPIRKG